MQNHHLVTTTFDSTEDYYTVDYSADNAEVITSESPLSFFQELLPSADRTALLYNLSYLCLAKFRKLERVIKECAIETQYLFGASEALLQKVKSVFF